MTAPDYELAIIGGGIHGVGIAEAAAARGWRCALFERTALAAGTSSRSSQLIHGGLRYLETGQFRLVRECLRERAHLLRTWPELVRLIPFHLPVYRHTRRRPWQLAAGLSAYAVLAGFSAGAGFSRLERNDWAGLDGLDTRQLQAVFRYCDGQTDDAALTRAVAAVAVAQGAEIHCPAELIHGAWRAGCWQLEFTGAAAPTSCTAGALINAAGPWVDAVLRRLHPAPASLPIDLVQGSHLLLQDDAPAAAYYLEAPDARGVFVLPQRGHTLVGTTETPFHGDDPATAAPTAGEIDYLLGVYSRYFPQRPARLQSAYAGVRVLPRASGSAFTRSRETRLLLADAPLRLLSIYGGKLTAYRATALCVLRAIESRWQRDDDFRRIFLK